MNTPTTEIEIKDAIKQMDLKNFKVTISLRSGAQLVFQAGANEGLSDFLREYEDFMRDSTPPEKQKTYYYAMRTVNKLKGQMLHLRLGDIEAVHSEYLNESSVAVTPRPHPNDPTDPNPDPGDPNPDPGDPNPDPGDPNPDPGDPNPGKP